VRVDSTTLLWRAARSTPTATMGEAGAILVLEELEHAKRSETRSCSATASPPTPRSTLTRSNTFASREHAHRREAGDP
jgi:hypothetical protein